MGTFLGHFLPGMAFIFLATWWSFNSCWRYWRSRMTGKPFLNKAAYQGSDRIPVETICKILGLIIHVLSEIVTGCDGDHTFLNNSQHITMLGFYLINAGMDLIHFYKVPSPLDLDYMSAILALFIEGFLFSQHLHGRSALDQKVHTLLYYPVILAAIFAMLEMVKRENWGIGIVRVSTVMLHGAWMVQAGFILYPEWVNSNWSSWEPDNHHQMMILPMMFSWHIMAVVSWQAVIMALMYRRAKAKFGSEWSKIDEVTQYSRVPDQPDEIA